MLIKQSTIIKAVVIVATLYILGYLDLVMSPNTDLFRMICGFIGVFLAIVIFFIPNKGPEYKKHIKFANLFFVFYIPIILLTAFLSIVWYKYKLMSALAIVMPYFFPLFAYPLVYIFTCDKSYHRFMKVIVSLVVIMLMIKAFAWFMYTFQGVTLFPNVLLKHSEEWVRNGVLRVDVGALYGVALCFLMSRFMVQKRHRAGVLALGMILFVVFITQYRYLEIVIMLSALLVYLTSTDSDKSKLIRILLLFSLVIAFIALGGLDAILASFSVKNEEYGSSNEARLLTIDYFWSIMNNFQHFVGLGFLYSYSPKATALLTRSSTLTYWMEDIGILGGFFTFGFMSFLIYVPLFFRSVKASLLAIFNKAADRAYLTSLVGYMISCCIMLNILDRQRLFDTAFYIALISFISSISAPKQLPSPLLEEQVNR